MTFDENGDPGNHLQPSAGSSRSRCHCDDAACSGCSVVKCVSLCVCFQGVGISHRKVTLNNEGWNVFRHLVEHGEQKLLAGLLSFGTIDSSHALAPKTTTGGLFRSTDRHGCCMMLEMLHPRMLPSMSSGTAWAYRSDRGCRARLEG